MVNVVQIRPRDLIFDLILQEKGVRALAESYYDEAEELELALSVDQRLRVAKMAEAERPEPIGPL
jgi:hypothetical protein